MKIIHITIRANVAWGEFQHVRLEVRMEPTAADKDKSKRDLRIEVADFVETTLESLVLRMRKQPEKPDDSNPELMPAQ